MHSFTSFLSSLLISVTSLFGQPHINTKKPATPPIRMTHTTEVAPMNASSSNVFSHASGTPATAADMTHATGTPPASHSPTGAVPRASSPSKQVSAKPEPKKGTSSGTQVPNRQPDVLPSALPQQPASTSVPRPISPQDPGMLAPPQSFSYPADDPDAPLPDTGNPCDLLDEGASCTLNGISGTCQIQGEAMVCAQ